MKKTKSFIIIVSFAICSLSSCSSGKEKDSTISEGGNPGLVNKTAINNENATQAPPPPPPITNETQDKSKSSEVIEKKIIKTADITIEVKDIKKARASIGSIVKKYKAYFSSEKETNSGSEISNTLAIRILSNSFDSLLNEIGEVAYNIDTKNISLDDVTEEYIDIEARLKNKKEVEKQYLELLKRANTVDEILNVNEHLRIVREEIESKEGRLKYLQSQVSFSTINLYMYQKSEKAYRGFGHKIIEGFEGGWKGILSFIIGLTYLWPLIILIVVAIWFFRQRRKKRAKIS